MSGRITRQIDPEYARQAALRGATLLVLVSIVMAGAPLGSVAEATAPQPQREARVASGAERAVTASPVECEEEHGAAANDAGSWRVERVAADDREPVCLAGVVRPLVRVALLDLPPPLG